MSNFVCQGVCIDSGLAATMVKVGVVFFRSAVNHGEAHRFPESEEVQMALWR